MNLKTEVDSLHQTERIPWVSLRYLIGEILPDWYINDDCERCLCQTYLESLDKEEFESSEVVTGFLAPTGLSSIQDEKLMNRSF
jgi:hypothetical protein